MLAVARRAGGVALLLTVATFTAAPGHAYPLGLSPGDVITSIEWDAIPGATFRVPTNLLNIDGGVNSVNIAGPSTIVQSNVTFTADLDFLSENLNIAPPDVQVNAFFGSPGFNPDLVVKENGINILLGNFVGNVIAGGNMNLAGGEAVFTAIGVIIIGGDPDLVNALGGEGSNVLLTGSMFGFDPLPADLVLPDNILFNSNFDMSMSGTLIPFNASPFVPEPSTALLLGGGLVALLGVSRRARLRRDRTLG
jgi:hypothetical protein